MAQIDDHSGEPTGRASADLRSAPVLRTLALRYSGALSRFFERRVSNKAEVADLVQDVFVRLAGLKDLSAIEKPDKYLFATAASALKDSARRDAVRHRRFHEEFDDLAHGGSELSPERILAGKQAILALGAALRELPERTRDVFVLRVFEGLKMDVVAAAVGISKRAAEKHYAKAMAHVAAAVKDKYGA